MAYFVTYKHSRAKKQFYGGTLYDSKFEAGYARELALRVKAGDIKRFEAHKKMPLVVNGYHVGDYYVDFVIYHNDGTIEYAETKGRKTAVFALKWKIFEAQYGDDPNVKLTLIMQRPFKMRSIRKFP